MCANVPGLLRIEDGVGGPSPRKLSWPIDLRGGRQPPCVATSHP